MSKENLLEVTDLKTFFFTPEGVVHAVDGVSLNLAAGKTLGVLGESGCGKSITALSIMGLIPEPPGKVVSGSIRYNGQNLLTFSQEQMRSIRGGDISMIFQEPMTSLNPIYTIGNQIAEVLLTHRRISQREAWERAEEMIKIVGIPSPKRRVRDYPHQLSGGMRQRAMIAMAMACNPKVLIADEPTTALDVTIQSQILDLMLGIQEKFGMAIMMITHDLGVIAEMSDHVIVMYAGEVVESASMDDLLTGACHPYAKGLIKSIPQLGKKFKSGKGPLYEIPGIVPDLIRLPPGCVFAPRCPSAFDKCGKERPPMFRIDGNHQVNCWLMEKEGSTPK